MAHILSQYIDAIQSGQLKTLEPLLGLFTYQGKPLTMRRHFQLSPMYTLQIPTHSVYQCGRQVGKSFGIAEKGILLSGFLPDYHTLYVQPRFDQIKRFNTAIIQPLLRSMVIRNDIIDKQQISSFLMRNFKRNSIMYMEFCLISPDRTRGISGVSHVFYDEAQDLDLDNIEIISEVMSASINYGFSQYTGTPKTTDGALSVLFDRSSQGHIIMPCSCGFHNMAHPEAELFKMIGKWDDNLKTGIHCAKCDKGLDCRKSYFKHMFPDRRPDFPGYHVGQITHPLHCALENKWRDLLYKYNNYTKAKFYNEIAGVPCDESVKLLTYKDILAASNDIEPTMEAALKARNYYDMVVMGVDWSGGGSLGKSFTAGAILGTRPGTQRLDCLHAFRLPMGMKPEDEAAILMRYMNEFKCAFLAHDYTGAGYLREVVLNQSGIPSNKLVPFTYAFVPKKDIISVHAPSDGARASYILDKARSLALMCGLIRSGMVTLPKIRDKDDHPVITDLLGLVEDPKELPRGGIAYMIQRAPDKSDDFAHALNMASSAIWKARGGYPNVAGLNRYELSAQVLKEIDPYMAGMMS